MGPEVTHLFISAGKVLPLFTFDILLYLFDPVELQGDQSRRKKTEFTPDLFHSKI